MSDDFAALLFFFGISMTVNVALAVSWFRSSRRPRRLEDQGTPRGTDDRRIERIEQAVDALATQVDQLAGGQEFLNRVVAERQERRARRLSEPVPENTPQ